MSQADHPSPANAVLVVPVMPDPYGDGRARRGYQWLRTLAADGRVHLLVVGEENPSPLPPEVALLAASVTVGVARRGGSRSVTILSLLFPFLTPRLRGGIDGWLQPTPSLRGELSALLSEAPFTRIVIYRLYLHDVARLLLPTQETRQNVPLAWDMDLDDLESASHLSIASLCFQQRRWREFFTHLAGARQYKVLEKTLLPKYRRVYVTAWEDKASLIGRAGLGRVRVRPNRILASPEASEGLQSDRLLSEDPEKASTPCTFLFVGGFGYLPNEDAARWIAQTLCPLLRSALRLPFRILIVGRGASPSLRSALSAVSEIDFRGEVPHMAPLYREAHAALVPVRAGSGTKFKTLEAFSYRCPVVAFPHAVRGLSATEGVHFLAAEGGPAFAEACSHLVRDPALQGRLAEAAYELLRDGFLLSAESGGNIGEPEEETQVSSR